MALLWGVQGRIPKLLQASGAHYRCKRAHRVSIRCGDTVKLPGLWICVADIGIRGKSAWTSLPTHGIRRKITLLTEVRFMPQPHSVAGASYGRRKRILVRGAGGSATLSNLRVEMSVAARRIPNDQCSHSEPAKCDATRPAAAQMGNGVAVGRRSTQTRGTSRSRVVRRYRAGTRAGPLACRSPDDSDNRLLGQRQCAGRLTQDACASEQFSERRLLCAS